MVTLLVALRGAGHAGSEVDQLERTGNIIKMAATVMVKPDLYRAFISNLAANLVEKYFSPNSGRTKKQGIFSLIMTICIAKNDFRSIIPGPDGNSIIYDNSYQ